MKNRPGWIHASKTPRQASRAFLIRIDEHDLDEQVWLVTRRRKEITSSAEMLANGGILV